jgi:hypothetical protein
MVRSPAFVLNLRNRDPAAFVREAEDEAVRLVGRYVPRTEGQRSWEIRGSNDRLNRVFELNRLPYDGYPGQDDADRRGKKPMVETKGDPAPAAAPSSKKRKLGTAMGGLGVSDGFARELMRTCAAPGERMSSPELRESSARMLKVTGGCWPRNVPIPHAASGDVFTSRLVRKWRVFPYGRNIAAVVSAVMDKDRQGVAQKRQAAIRIVEARPKRQKRESAKAAAPGGGKPPLAVKSGVPASGKAPEAAAGAGGSKPAKAVPPLSGVAEAAKAARALPSAGKRVADFATNICVEDYLGGKSLAFFLICWCVAGSDEGQLAMVVPAAAIVMAGIVPKARGEALGSGGEVSALAVVRDEAGAATRRLKGVTEALSQATEALSQVR